MKKFLKFKNEKGITLLTLILAIAVLIILVMIITKANKSENRDMQIGLIEIKTEGMPLVINEDSDEMPKGKLKVVLTDITGEVTWSQPDEKVAKISNTTGEEITVTAVGKGRTKIIATCQGINKEYTIKVIDSNTEQIKVGDYIEYDCYTGVDSSLLKYKTPSGLTGNIVDQEYRLIENDAKLNWKVLEYNENEILITTANPVYTEKKLTLKGKEGYVNGPEEINKICAMFGYGKNSNNTKYSYQYNQDTRTSAARSIDVEDINKISERLNEETKTFYYKFDYDGNICHSSSGVEGTFEKIDMIRDKFEYYNGNNWADLEKGGSISTGIIDNGYHYSISTNGNFLIYSDDNSSNYCDAYWIASNGNDCHNILASYFVRFIHQGWLENFCLYYSDGRKDNATFAIRPVVSLKSDLNWEKIDNVWKVVE